jgi:hypothetical protein
VDEKRLSLNLHQFGWSRGLLESVLAGINSLIL